MAKPTPFIFGTNKFVAEFPNKLPDAIAKIYEQLIGVPVRPPQIRQAIEKLNFDRPSAWRVRYEKLAVVRRNPSYQPTDYRKAGKVLAEILMDADACWEDACKLREYEAPGSVATCEIAFARAAVIRFAIRRSQPEKIAVDYLRGVDQYVSEAFLEDSEETITFYKNERLSVIAPRAIRHYEENVFPLAQLADMVAHRLSVPGIPSIEIAPLFEEVEAEAKRLMNATSALDKLYKAIDNVSEFEEYL
jgi:hypothetical protein